VAVRLCVEHQRTFEVVFVRERGTGRPTKRERRELDHLRRP
jgi:hypothetical protein